MHMSYCLYLLIVCGLAAGAAQSGSNGCILPPYPAHGTYTVHDRPEAVPGQTYGLAILKVTCDPGYRVIGNNATYCFSNNDWQHPMPRCTRFCRLTPDPSVKYFCKVTGDGILGGTRLCHELEPHGTVVVPMCNYPVYYSSSVLLNMHCVDGAWDHVATCQPDCGTPLEKGQEIIITGKGTKAAHGDSPWHAAIYDKSYTPFMQVCGGSLVSTKVIISAAHCFWNDGQQPASRYAVALGKIYRPWNDSMDLGAHKSDVKEIKMPARFFGEVAHYQDDIALVIMSTPVVYNTYIRPVCLDLDDEFDRNQLQSSSSGRVTGWGLTSADGVESPVLLTAELPYVDVRKCLDNLDFEFWSYVTSDKICAGSTDGATVCKGDGGGGLVFPNEDRGTRRYFLRGVVSTAPISGHNCNANTFTTFTHILPHATFIRDHGLGIVSVRDGSDSGIEPVTFASSGTVRPNVEKEKASTANRSDSEASVAAADVTITKVKNPDQNRKPSTTRTHSEFEPVTVASSGTVRPNVEKGKASTANRSDSDESVAAADINITKVENPDQNKKPSTPSSAAPKKMETKNPFDVFGIFPEEAHKPDGMGPLESSITSRVPNGTTKRACTLNGDYFLELRVYNTADISGVLIQKRWKKAFVTLRAQIVDESAEWEALQTFIKKISALFKDADVKFYSNDTK